MIKEKIASKKGKLIELEDYDEKTNSTKKKSDRTSKQTKSTPRKP